MITAKLLFLAVFVPASAAIAYRVAAPGDRRYMVRSVLAAWLLLGALVVAVNVWQPFTDTALDGGADDHDYWPLISDSPPADLTEALDIRRFVGVMDQPGYPWLLSMLSLLTGDDLVVLKWLNLFFLILLSVTWYRIGLILEGRLFARRMGRVILLLSPLWFYVCFLLKDMAITLLQSVFLLFVMEMWHGRRLRPAIGVAMSTLALLLFRTPLVIQNGAVLTGSVASKLAARGVGGRRVTPLFVAMVLLLLTLPVVTNVETMNALGIFTESRVVGAAMLESAAQVGEGTQMNRTLFALLYLFSEVSGLNPRSWSTLGSLWLRGVLALPWIFVVTPFFLVGCRHVLTPTDGTETTRGVLAKLRRSRLLATPWSAVCLFVLSSIAVSWVVGDSTRWRVPDMPMVAAVALLGWSSKSASWRRKGLRVWIASTCVLFGLYYLVR